MSGEHRLLHQRLQRAEIPRIQPRTIEQLMAGVPIERPSGNVAVDETFRKAPKAKGRKDDQNELRL